MLFQTQGFILLFLPAVLALYWAVAGNATARQWVIILASLVFYGWWDVRFIPLLLGQIAFTWAIAELSFAGRRSAIIALGIVFNLLCLGSFKYLDFFIASLEAIIGISLPRSGLILPIGISFFSFQLISYLIDLKRGQAPLYEFRPFAAFVLLFPHLIAGPIVRHNELVPQFDLDPRRDGVAQRFSAGGVLFTLGLAKKVLLADNLAPMVDPLFQKALGASLSFGEAWSAALGFSLQLFLDFSAYTEMAIGIALMFGLILPENFNRPYLATSLRDFWRRWHISLSLFLRDYLYIALGGSRAGALRFAFATLVTMGLCGLWHGAGWTFLVWGLWHGAGLIACRLWQSLKLPLRDAVGWLLTMLFVIIGWVLFRAHDFASAGDILVSMSGNYGFFGQLQSPLLLAIAALVVVLVPSAHTIKDQMLAPKPWIALGAAGLAAYCVLAVGQGAVQQFIYFQF